MRVLLLTRSFDHRLGGMEFHTRLLVEHFIEKGWEVIIATPELPPTGAIFKEPRASYIRLGKSPNSLIKYSPGFWLKVRKLLRSSASDYDVIINISMAIGGAVGLPRSTKAKIVSIAHGTYVLERRTLMAAVKAGDTSLKTLLGIPYTYLFDIVQRGVIARSVRVLCVSENVYESLTKNYGVPPDKLMIVRNFVTMERFKPHTYEHKDRYDLLFLARLHREKGLFVLLNALNTMREKYPQEFAELTCSIAGEGPDAEQTKQQVQEMKLTNVKLLGNVLREQVPELMHRSDIYVFPTLRLEGLPLSLLEAMAAGLPTIASDIEGPNEVIENNKSGILFAPGDAEALISAIVRLLRDDKLRQTLGRQGRSIMEQDFNATKQLAKIDALLTEISGDALTSRAKS